MGNDAEAPLPLEEALVLLAEAEEARAAADARLGRRQPAWGCATNLVSWRNQVCEPGWRLSFSVV